MEKLLGHPNTLTLFRVIAVPIIVILMLFPNRVCTFAAAILFSAAAITDYLDGYIARTRGLISNLGKVMDPVADKLMVVVALVLLVEANPTPLIAIPSIIIISREILVSALREWMAELGARAAVKVSVVGKAKTVVQLVSIIFLIYNDSLFGIPLFELGILLFYVAAFLTLYSMYIYLRAAWPVMIKHS